MTKLVMVTGGPSGVGRATLSACGSDWRRVDVSRSGPPPEADEHVSADLADPARWGSVGAGFTRLVQSASWDRIVLVHAAGTIEPIGFAGEHDPADYVRPQLLSAIVGPAIGARFLASVRLQTMPRDLVMVSSGTAVRPHLGWSAYCAGKAAIKQWVRTVGLEQQRSGVRVVAVQPGLVDSPMQRVIRSADRRDFPSVEQFRDRYRERVLRSPTAVARRLWELLKGHDLASGEVCRL